MARGIADYFAAGGPIVFVLALLSLVSLTLIVVKVLELWRVHSGARQRRQALELWERGDRDAAVRTLRAGLSPADRVSAYAMEGIEAGVDRAALRVEIERRGNDEIEGMSRHLRALEVIAVVSPLLGLLGTVLGMIQSFQGLETAEGAANAAALAGGIWEALLTTAAGLIVAIPAAAGANLLAARVDSAGHLIEDTIGRLFAIEDLGRTNG